jgi:hypothetical protein
MEDVHDDEIRTEDLIDTILRHIPLSYQREIIGDVNGEYEVYTRWARHSRHAVPSGWCRTVTSGTGPAPPPGGPRSGHDVTGPDINLDFPEAQVGCEALEAAKWLRTAA